MKKLVLVIGALLVFSFAKADEGMWLLSRLKQQNIDEMQTMGFRLTAEDIYSVNQPGIKDAIVGICQFAFPSFLFGRDCFSAGLVDYESSLRFRCHPGPFVGGTRLPVGWFLGL